ncbi:uncharacterized protein LOC125369559 [Ricinus communis]|uniref:uncharacterized protein LOC125369559 n=1 Tax=Ricinus communis TaxID=3988 RepID=UPI00201A8E5D|nr:uncharacterized protein LOC125369559 [Ricinus communis]
MPQLWVLAVAWVEELKEVETVQWVEGIVEVSLVVTMGIMMIWIEIWIASNLGFLLSEAYLECEKQVDLIFDCPNCYEEKKVRNLISWQGLLPYVEFSYNRVVHSTKHCSPFEIVYGFNPLTPIDLFPLPLNKLVNVDGSSKERFPNQRRPKLSPRDDGPFQVLERIYDNAYKIDLQDDESDSRTNHPKEEGNDIDRLTLKDVDLVRLDDKGNKTESRKDPLSLSQGPITRSKVLQAQGILL